MTSEPESATQEVVDRLSAKLQAFIDGLPDDEQRAMGNILQQASTEDARDVAGYAIGPPFVCAVGLSQRRVINFGMQRHLLIGPPY